MASGADCTPPVEESNCYAGVMSLLTSRRLVIAGVTFALFVVFDIALFGWLIFNSLSQREVEEALLKTRAEAEPLARKLEEQALSLGQDLYVAVSVVQEQTTYIDAFPTQRERIRRFEIRDGSGTVVYQEESATELPAGDVPLVERGQGPDSLELKEVEVPIGDLGSIIIGLNEKELQKSIEVLRRDLARQTSWIGLLTLTLLVAAFVAIWMLMRRGRRLEEQAVEAERLAYIGTLASGLAHEIRNPLNSLSLNMQMLEEEVSHLPSSGRTRHRSSRSSQKRLLEITRSELHRLERLATDFLSYARPQPLELSEVPAVELLERVREVMRGEILERGAEVEIDDRSAGARVRVDREQINQLLINLTHNALAAFEGGGPPVVRLVARRRGDGVALEVSDRGQGISKEDQERMFELFFSTRKGGTGLGLAIVKRIARAHGAGLEVETEPGVGTTVRLTLEAVEARDAIADADAATAWRARHANPEGAVPDSPG